MLNCLPCSYPRRLCSCGKRKLSDGWALTIQAKSRDDFLHRSFRPDLGRGGGSP